MWSAVHFPNNTWDISSRSRATTATDKKACCTCKLSCCFANLNLLLFTVSFVAIICLSSLPFQGPPTISVLTVVQRLGTLSLTERRSILFSGPLNGRETPIGPVAGHYKNPILPFGLVLNFLLFFRQRLLKQLYIYKLERQKDLQKTSSHALLFNADVSPFGLPQCIYKIKTWIYIYSFQQFFVSSVFPHFFSLSTSSFCVFLAPHHPRLGSLYLLLGNCPPTPSLNQP